jgi:XTP/dITP diphosphohydrolase
LRGDKVWMATGNRHKYGEAREVMAEMGIELEHMEVERVEIQADDLADIAAYSLRQIPDDGRPLVVEDAGIFIDHYGGFPGPYSSYALRTIDLPGVLRLMEGVEERKSSFQSVVAYRHEEEIHCFRGVVKGSIANRIKGTGGFGFDPIFIPDKGDGRTFGEMTAEEKNALSHRARAFRSLGEWLSGSE